MHGMSAIVRRPSVFSTRVVSSLLLSVEFWGQFWI